MFDLEERSGGVLLHLTSLPGPHGNGDLGAEAHRFAGQLAAAGQRWWQMLPVGPPGEGNSPYSARSAFAGSPLLIDLAALARDGVLRELAVPPRFPAERVDHAAAAAFRERELRRAFAAFERGRKRASYRAFRERAAAWLEDFALFSALRSAAGGAPWIEWERELRLRRPGVLARARRELASEIEFHRFQQWLFDGQGRRFSSISSVRAAGPARRNRIRRAVPARLAWCGTVRTCGHTATSSSWTGRAVRRWSPAFLQTSSAPRASCGGIRTTGGPG